jgi:hypothetical protein
MTRTISLITATVGAALLFALPAYGEGRPAEPADFWNYESGAKVADTTPGVAPEELASLFGSSLQENVTNMLDARERSLGAGAGNGKLSALDAREQAFQTKQVATPAPDWFERAAEAAIRDYRVPVVDDRFRIDPTSGQNPVTVSSGRELELPEIGIGVGLLLALAIGAFLMIRHTRGRPLAH